MEARGRRIKGCGSFRKRFWIPTLIELCGATLLATGLGYEIAVGADLGYTIITAGSLLIALGSILYAKFKPWLEG